jgi:hypothetical protein
MRRSLLKIRESLYNELLFTASYDTFVEVAYPENSEIMAIYYLTQRDKHSEIQVPNTPLRQNTYIRYHSH